MYLLSLADSVRLRREYFGGIAFDTSTGTTVDVDKAAFNMLSIISINSAVSQEDLIKILRSTGLVSGKNSKAATKVIKRFLELGILRIKPHAVDGNDYSQTFGNDERLLKIPEFTKGWRFGNYLSAPETVHWAITFRCASNCPDCYAKRHLELFSCEMDTRDALRAVDTISEWGVFQLAIGGGEPLLRSDLKDITARASQNGLAVHITTGYDNLDLAIFQKLSGNIKCLQIGVKHDRLMAQPQAETAMLKRIVETSTGAGIQTGANLILSKSSIKNFEPLLDSLVRAGITRITLLRYKPPKDILRWKQENPSVEMMAEFETKLSSNKSSVFGRALLQIIARHHMSF
ncbi:MAG: radical SAM protein [Actinobacteria bacterium]|nr:radical SAM protein [Actinomycetota bacterium]